MTSMNLNKLTAALLLAGAWATSASAATPSDLQVFTAPASATTAKIAGGATINKGANFLAQIPDDQPIGIEGMITPATADVGKAGNLYVVANVGAVWAMLTPTGFQIWDSSVATLKPYMSKTLAANETISVSDIEAIANTTLDGSTIKFYLGYSAGGTSPLVYSSPITFSVAATNTNTTTCPAGTTAATGKITAKAICRLQGTYTTNLHLNNNFDYLLSGAVFIGGDNTNSASITIDAGTTMYGESGKDFLVINRGSKIFANGTKTAPIVMTTASEDTATTNTRGRWGGLILNGNAPINTCAAGTALCEASGEGSTGLYGGNNAADSSGNLNYLQVRYPGFQITPENELNGISFQGVGSGTLVDYIQVYNSADDAVEFFGGTVNVKHAYLIGSDDDNIDWTFGYSGKIQFAVVVQSEDTGDHGIEADNNGSNHDALPRAQPKLSNLTFIGNKNTTSGILVRVGTGANISNAVVKGFGKTCLDIDNDATFINAGTSATSLSGKLTLTNSDFDCLTPPGNFDEEVADKFKVSDFFHNQAGNVETATNMTTYVNSTAVNALTAAAPFDAWFDNAPFVGAVKDTASDWTLGWTYRP